MVQSSSTASLRFKKLADNLCPLNMIGSKIADNAKFEYDSFQSDSFSQGQSFVEGFPFHKLTIDDNMQEKSVVSQRPIYDRL